jgi:hypothetical protein
VRVVFRSVRRARRNEIRDVGYGVGREEIAGWGEVAAPVLWGDAVYGAISSLKPSSLLRPTDGIR